jgi:hypothetical protein
MYLTDRSHNLRIECSYCFSFCYAALYFSNIKRFPPDKDAGHPYLNLQPDFSCPVYSTLTKKRRKGCLAFDCFGTGKKVTRSTPTAHCWRTESGLKEKMFDVFLVMRQLHEMLWYLTEASALQMTGRTAGDFNSLFVAITHLTLLPPQSLLKLDIDEHRTAVKTLLQKIRELARSETAIHLVK